MLLLFTLICIWFHSGGRRGAQKQGVQLISVDPISEKYSFLKFTILETYGASKTYLNQVYLLEENIFLKVRNTMSPSSVQETEIQEREDRSAPRLNIPKPMQQISNMQQAKR